MKFEVSISSPTDSVEAHLCLIGAGNPGRYLVSVTAVPPATTESVVIETTAPGDANTVVSDGSGGGFSLTGLGVMYGVVLLGQFSSLNARVVGSPSGLATVTVEKLP